MDNEIDREANRTSTKYNEELYRLMYPGDSMLYDRIINVTFIDNSQLNKEKSFFVKGDPDKERPLYLAEGYNNSKVYGTEPKYYTFDSDDEFRAELDNFQAGDNIYFRHGHSRQKWHIALASTEGNYLRRTFTITCPKMGVKPDISLKITTLPNQLCCKATVRVCNMCFESLDVRQWTDMRVTAGYSSGARATFDIPIFTSFIEDPAPNGYTVFMGVTVGEMSNPLKNHVVGIDFTGVEDFTVEELIAKISLYVCTSAQGQVTNYLCNKLNNVTITSPKSIVKFDNSYALLHWLQEILTNAFKAYKDENGVSPHIIVQISTSGDSLYIFSTTCGNKPINDVHTTDVSVVDLTAVSKASFDGTACTIEAPWNPALGPGDLFTMPPTFITGKHLPNIMGEELYRNSKDLYRVIKQTISFRTVGNENTMSLIALPEQYMNVMESQDVVREVTESIIVMTKTNGETVTQDAQGRIDTFNPAGWLEDAVTVKPDGDCWSTIAQNIYGYMDTNNRRVNGLFESNNPVRLDVSIGSAAYKKILNRVPTNIKSIVGTLLENTKYVGTWALWPCICIASHLVREEQMNKTGSSPITPVDLHDPENFQAGMFACAPKFISFDDVLTKNAQASEFFRLIHQAWVWDSTKATSYYSWRQEWATLYYYYGGIDLLPGLLNN